MALPTRVPSQHQDVFQGSPLREILLRTLPAREAAKPSAEHTLLSDPFYFCRLANEPCHWVTAQQAVGVGCVQTTAHVEAERAMRGLEAVLEGGHCSSFRPSSHVLLDA